MIMYCQKCKAAFDGDGNCPVCGSTKVRPALSDDVCFLTDADPISGGMLEDVLGQNGIPVLSISTVGAGMAMKAGTRITRPIILFVLFLLLLRVLGVY